jgi:4'-phosphopantetheinyl transferase
MNTPRWVIRPAGRRGRPREVDVWLVDLDHDDPGGTLMGMITPEEREEASRRRSSVDGRRFAIGRASLRAILGGYAGTSGQALRLIRESRGRMVLDPSTQLTFSVAHAAAVGLVAVGHARSIGIDVEPVSAAGQIADVSEHLLPSDRIAAIRSAPQDVQDEQWLKLWTEVEAYAKLDGRGLVNAHSTEVLLAAREHRVQFRPVADHVATLIYTGQSARVTYVRFTAPGAEQPGVGETVSRTIHPPHGSITPGRP